ncbi:MAG TPA: hypothetical protein VJ720_04415 [Chitinophaga sp.]|nr:hypothetical protein [Chitinophaga sp.]
MRFSLLILLLLSLTAGAQTIIPFDSPRWKITGNGFVQETHLGRPAYRLEKGAALLEDANFKNGIIEFDIALAKERYFPAIEFRVQDEYNYEQYYLRPHQSGNPDAMQYTPVYNNSAGWQLYYGAGYNNPVILPFDRWLHVKLVVLGSQAEVYFDQDSTPVLFIRHLRRDVAAGMIKLSNMASSPAWYSNFTYTATDAVTIKSKAAPVPALPATVITSWMVSSPFNEKLVADKLQLSVADTAKLSWKHLDADELGVTDLAMLSRVDSNSNTVFARKIIYADKPGTKKLTLGFSDRVRVYLNNRLQYAGTDGFMSRDYRFLGTIGYFDAIYLDLKRGRNELWIAVSEDFGGWGIKAKLE